MSLLSLEELEKLYSRGYYLYQTGNFCRALEIFQELLTVDPTYPPYVHAWAASLQASGDYTRAVISWSTLIHIKPNHLLAYLHLAECLLSMKAIEQALHVLEKAKQWFTNPPTSTDLPIQNRITFLEARWRSL